MTKRLLFIYPFVLLFALLGLTVLTNTNARAAVAGENGPIVYVENQSQNTNGSEFVAPIAVPEQTDNSVITSNPDGSNTQIVASEDDVITAVGISPPTAEDTYDIAYATNTSDLTACNDNEASCARVSTVNVTETGVPTASSEELTTLHSLLNNGVNRPSDTWVSNVSYSPTGDSILATVYTDNKYNMKSSLVLIDNTTGNTETVVAARKDPCLNGGFADNGYIYYSRINTTNDAITSCYGLNSIDDEENYQSDIWVIKPGEAPTKLTHTPNKSEFFIDVSPDNKYVLVADANAYRESKCLYAPMFIYRSGSFNAYGCRYYYVDTTTGEIIKLPDMPEGFTPSFFSPDNKSIIGTYFPFIEGRSAAFMVDTTVPYTALVDRTTFELVALTNQLGVTQWSPSVSNETPVVPSTPITTTQTNTTKSATLANTGIDATYILVIAMVLFGTGSALLASQKRL